MQRAPDVLVIGGGVIGCAVADAVAASGRSVLLTERGALGGEASSAAAGVLGVASGDDDGPRLALRAAGLERFASLVARLEEETGVDVEYAACGALQLSLTDEEQAAAHAKAERRRRETLRVEILDAREVHATAPLVSPSVRGGVLFPDDARIDSARLVAALAASARRRRAELVAGAPVVGAERDGDRIARVRVAAEWVTPGSVVLAAGAWSGRVPQLVPGLRVAPARGQMLALRPPAPPSSHVLFWADGCLVPRANGEVLVGGTVEDVGFTKAVTPSGLATLVETAVTMAPTLAAAPVVRAWAGLRPFAPDGGPLLGPMPGTRNLIVACGHHRNGILLAPITAAVVAALLDGAPAPVDVAPFLPAARGGA